MWTSWMKSKFHVINHRKLLEVKNFIQHLPLIFWNQWKCERFCIFIFSPTREVLFISLSSFLTSFLIFLTFLFPDVWYVWLNSWSAMQYAICLACTSIMWNASTTGSWEASRVHRAWSQWMQRCWRVMRPTSLTQINTGHTRLRGRLCGMSGVGGGSGGGGDTSVVIQQNLEWPKWRWIWNHSSSLQIYATVMVKNKSVW